MILHESDTPSLKPVQNNTQSYSYSAWFQASAAGVNEIFAPKFRDDLSAQSSRLALEYWVDRLGRNVGN